MSAQTFADAIEALLVSDATFAAAITALLGVAVPRVLRGNRPTAQIPGEMLPCFVLEQGDGLAAPLGGDDDSGMTIGNHLQGFQSDVSVALVWRQDSRDTAADQRAALPKLFAQLCMRNPQPGDIVGAWLESWEPDRAVNHPLHVWAANIRGLYTISKD